MKRTLLFLLVLVLPGLMGRAQDHTATVAADASDLRTVIDKNIYGQFSEHLGGCIYGGIWVGKNSKIPNTDGIRNDVVAALKKIRMPVDRWPGGCFADEYHWKDGIGPKNKRATMVNTNWGGVTEDNSFGTHEFLRFCSLTGGEPYITGNVGSGTVQEMSQWVEYINSDNVSPMTMLRKANGRDKSWGVKYWAIGNENWGCGGNMTPDYYADQVRRYGTYLRNYGGNRLYKIACGPSSGDYAWTETMMKDAMGYMNGLALHHYAFNDGKPARDFDEAGWFDLIANSLSIEGIIDRHCAIMDKYDPNRKVALIVDEWGNWFGVEPGTNPAFLFQQNTLRDAVTAASNLNIFNNHADRIRMANIAQLVNVLQALILTDGARMVCTPTYHVFDMMKVHQNAMLVKTSIESPDYVYKGKKLQAVNCSASIDKAGTMHVSFVNIDPNSPQSVTCSLKSFKPRSVSGQILTAAAMNACNTFEQPNSVVPAKFTDCRISGTDLSVTLPPKSVVVVEVEGTYELPPPLEVKDAVPGVKYEYYEGQWENIPSFGTLTPLRSGTIDRFVIPEPNSSENFGVRYTGYIKLPADGLYTFFVNSDDGAALVIDKNLVVDNDGRHAPQEASGTVNLRKGFHEISVTFFQAGGGKVLEVSIEGPGMKKQGLPAGLLFH